MCLTSSVGNVLGVKIKITYQNKIVPILVFIVWYETLRCVASTVAG